MSTITNQTDSNVQDVSILMGNFNNLNTDKAEISGQVFTGDVSFSGSGHAGLKVNSLTTTQRNALTPANGMVIYNSTTGAIEVYQGSAWSLISADPTGSIKLWTTASAPTGYLLCDGTAVSRSTYSNLFAVISTAYGVGDNSTTFNIPNLKGKVPVGLSSTDTEFDMLGETGGEKTHVITEAELASHNHGVHTNASNSGGNSAFAGSGGAPSYWVNNIASYTNTTALTNTLGSNTAHNNLQPYITLNYIIKF